ncbi:MAG: hypothetical protein ABSG00_09610 [Terracidiphilus sp.]|jgi:thiol:disulfide interchange protein
MESFLNSVWALLAIAILCSWLRFQSRTQRDSRRSLMAVIVLIAILFPVISVSDDLWAIHNPAETDTCQRRDHLTVCPHFITPAVAALPARAFAGMNFGFQRVAVSFHLPPLAVDNPAFDAIDSRPPPVA